MTITPTFYIRQGSPTPVLAGTWTSRAADGSQKVVPWTPGTTCTWSMAPYLAPGRVGPDIVLDHAGVASNDGNGNLQLSIGAAWPAAAVANVGDFALTFKVSIGGAPAEEWPVGPAGVVPAALGPTGMPSSEDDWLIVRIEPTLG